MRRPAAVLVLAPLLLGGGGAEARPAATCASGASALAAYVRSGSLRSADLATCSVRLLVRSGVEPPVRFSHDGRWIAFGPAPAVVVAAGGAVSRPLGPPAGDGRWLPWAWSPRADVLARVAPDGGVVVGGPGRAPRRLLPAGWDARTLAFDPSGMRLAVSRPYSPFGKLAAHQEIWVLDVVTGARRLVYRLPRGLAPPELAWWSPDGRRIFFWPDVQNSSSLRADGMPLRWLPATGGRTSKLAWTLVYADYGSWCRRRLVVAAGAWRLATWGKRLVVASPPSFRPRDLSRDRSRSWVSPACLPAGDAVVAAAGSASQNLVRPGRERRALWLLRLDGRSRRQLTRPPAGFTDEAPRVGADGGTILFVRTSGRPPFRGTLEALRPWWPRPRPIAGLGPGQSYYGHYGWSDVLDVSRRS
jgi:dipeptidyl aminopeptidase/acylaminoacyl peptidase